MGCRPIPRLHRRPLRHRQRPQPRGRPRIHRPSHRPGGHSLAGDGQAGRGPRRPKHRPGMSSQHRRSLHRITQSRRTMGSSGSESERTKSEIGTAIPTPSPKMLIPRLRFRRAKAGKSFKIKHFRENTTRRPIIQMVNRDPQNRLFMSQIDRFVPCFAQIRSQNPIEPQSPIEPRRQPCATSP